MLIIKRAWDIGQASQYDVVYLLRELVPDLIREPWMEMLLAQVNQNVVFDFDDALCAPPSWAFGPSEGVTAQYVRDMSTPMGVKQ